eukprot:COSAG05_NODE_1384_length_5014_cov_19.104440_6_plen_92_part_00
MCGFGLDLPYQPEKYLRESQAERRIRSERRPHVLLLQGPPLLLLLLAAGPAAMLVTALLPLPWLQPPLLWRLPCRGRVAVVPATRSEPRGT